MKELWPDSFVEEGNLSQHVFALRRALGENHSEPRFIETVARRGYRFKAAVNQVQEPTYNGAAIIPEVKVDSVVPDTAEETGSLSANLPAVSLPWVFKAGTRNVNDFASNFRQLKRRWRVATVSVLTLTTIIGATLVVRPHLLSQSEVIDSIAVLPFVNTNADPSIEYLLDGFTESIINNLSQRTDLRVVSTTTMFRYKGKHIEPQNVARELGVRAVLTGEITKQDDNLVIRTELIDAVRDAHLWGEQYNRKLAHILAVQEDISREISSNLRLRLTDDGQRWIKRNTNNAEAYQLYLKGRYFWNKRTQEGVGKGINYLQQAIDADPLYSLAYAGQADSYILLRAPLNALPPKEAFLKAKAAATKALEIDPTLAEAHATLGVVKQRFEWDMEGAAKEFRLAIELNPSYATAHQWYAINFEIMGDGDAALVEARQAYELDPLSIIINARLGHTYYFSRRYDHAVEQYKKTLELDPNFPIAHSRLGLAYAQKGMNREAVEALLKGAALSGESPETITSLKNAFAKDGMRGYWRKVLESEREKARHRYVSAYEIAVIYARLADNDQTFKWLDKAYEERSSALVYVKVDPSFDGIRHDPRYKDLLGRLNLG
jgi:TolB-like protein/Flp pilus assembly protein TadD